MIDQTGNQLQRVERTFQEALKLSSEERDAYLEEQCQDDPAIKQEVMELLEIAGTRGPLDRRPPTAVDFSKLSDVAVTSVPDRIGPFKIVHRIASGGMGIVYEALQEQPRRTVALKVMRWELNSTEAFRRFEYESTLLSRLRHPGIAQVYEAGIHENGAVRLPYFAMEYVAHAESLTQYADKRQLSVRQRLGLFARVCEAVEHGHRRGIVHRDLKPSNILVDREGEPRVVDFGVARSTDADMALTTMQTETGQLLGTLQYMSPEQCAGEANRIDIRSDVYSLGVVLFELLAGKPPYDVRGVSVYEGTRIVIETCPARLSTIDKLLRGDLETIVAKAMEKDCDRRYDHAGELADDVRRYLNGESILARPTSVVYQLRIFARRNKVVAAAIACVIGSLAVGLVATSTALVKAKRARMEAGQVTSVLNEAFSSADPEFARGEEVTVREVLDSVADRIGKDLSFGSNSLAEADLRITIGRTYRHLGVYEKAVAHLKKGVEIRRNVLGEHPDVVDGLAELAIVHMRSQTPGFRLFFEEAVAMHKSNRFPDSLAMGLCLAHLHDTLDDSVHDAAQSSLEEALAMLRRVQGNESREIAWVLTSFGLLKQRMRDLDEAERYYRQSLEMRRKVLGQNHPHIIYDYLNLRWIAQQRNDFELALQWALKSKELAFRVLGPDHPLYGSSVSILGNVQMDIGDYEAAERNLREGLELELKALGPDHGQIWYRYDKLRTLAGRRQDLAEAKRWALKQKEFADRLLTRDDSLYARSYLVYGGRLFNDGEYQRAEPILREAVATREKLEYLGNAKWVFAIRITYGACLARLERFDEAVDELMGTFEELQLVDDKSAWKKEQVCRTCEQLAAIYEACDTPTEAARWRNKGLAER